MSADSDYKEINLFDYLMVVIKHRHMILKNTLIAAVAMAIISLFLPSKYTATTTLLPPEDNIQPSWATLLSNADLPLLNLGIQASSSEIFVEILKSHSVANIVLNKKYQYQGKSKSLLEIWDTQEEIEAIQKLHKRSKIYANKQGIIYISVELNDPDLAAQVANAFAMALDRINQEKSISKAKNSRIYIEEQLKKTEKNLKEAAEKLAKFQEQHKAVSLEEQTKVAIEKAGELKGTIIAKEMELNVALQTMKPDNPRIIRLQKELDELKKQYEHLQFGNTIALDKQKDYFIPFSEVPEISLKLAELIREVKVQETIWQLLNQQYYSAKIQEARDTPTVQILDEAVPPQERSSPKRSLLVIITAVLGFSFSLFWAFVLEYSERIKQNQEEYSKIQNMINEIKRDIQQSRRKLMNFFAKVQQRWRT